ncbi:MAG: MBOAT family O-acyltransferase [Pseudomonadota bacterium]
MNLLAILVLACAVAIASYPVLMLPPRPRWVLVGVMCLGLGVTPLLLSDKDPLGRFVIACFVLTLWMKHFDIQVDQYRGWRVQWRSFAAFMLQAGGFVRRRLVDERHMTRADALRRLGLELPTLGLGLALAVLVSYPIWDGTPFLLEHAAKVTAFYFVCIPCVNSVTTLVRLCGGGDCRYHMEYPLAACTPADFWRRYNRTVQQFFWEDVFKPLGGIRTPIRSTLLVFALSALIHEYAFDIAVGRVQGYQLAFFMLQGLAVVATWRIKPKGWTKPIWWTATLVFNLLTSVLFFASFNGLVSFYSRGLPAWFG